MGVNTNNIYEDRNSSMVTLEQSNETIRKVIKEIEDEEKHCTLFIYARGHAVSILDKQILLCDSKDKNEVLFSIELKVRMLTEEYDNLDVFAIYNFSRHNIEKFEELK